MEKKKWLDISYGMLNFKFQNLTPVDETGLYIKFLNSVMEENKDTQSNGTPNFVTWSYRV